MTSTGCGQRGILSRRIQTGLSPTPSTSRSLSGKTRIARYLVPGMGRKSSAMNPSNTAAAEKHFPNEEDSRFEPESRSRKSSMTVSATPGLLRSERGNVRGTCGGGRDRVRVHSRHPALGRHENLSWRNHSFLEIQECRSVCGKGRAGHGQRQFRS